MLAEVVELKLVEYCLYVLPSAVVMELVLGPRKALESFICLKAFMEWSVVRSPGRARDLLTLAECELGLTTLLGSGSWLTELNLRP